MDGDLPRLAGVLQGLFTERVATLNQQVGCVRRERGFSAESLVRLLVFGWIDRPNRPFAELAEQAGVSAQALQQRLTDRAVALFGGLFNEALTHVFMSRRPLIPLLQRFPSVEIHDATQLVLPPCLAEQYPACGGLDGQRGNAGWKLLLRFDALSGQLHPFELMSGKTSDHNLAADPLAYVQAGTLYLADLGFFNLQRLQGVVQRQAHYITRLPARVNVADADSQGQPVGLWLQQQNGDVVDTTVRIGQHQELTTRLVAVRVPEVVAAKRRQKLLDKARKRGRQVSANQLALCNWWVGVTDIPATELSVEEIRILYGVRWQVELVFKHWKQAGGLGCLHGLTAASVQVEYLAKLLGVIITHWQALLAGGPLEGKNRLAVHRRVCAACNQMAAVLKNQGAFVQVLATLKQLAVTLKNLRCRCLRKKAPSTRQQLYGKRVAA